MPTGLNILTHSRMQSYKTCPRQHYYLYEEGIRSSSPSGPLRMGDVIHRALDMRATGSSEAEALQMIRTNYSEIPGWVQELDAWMIECETCCTLVRGYYWRWQEEELQYTQSEQAFHLPIINPQTGRKARGWSRAGKIDKCLIVDSRNAIGEHKTCSEDIAPSADYWRRLRMDQQISMYYSAANELGLGVETVLYDVIRKPEMEPLTIPIIDNDGLKIVNDDHGNRVMLDNGKPRQAANKAKGWTMLSRKQSADEYGERVLQDIYERPDWYFARKELPRLDSDIAEFLDELWQIHQQIREARKHKRWFRNTAACLKPYRCPCFELCLNGLYPLRVVPDGFVRVENLHQELGDSNGNRTAAESGTTSAGIADEGERAGCEACEEVY